MGGTFYATRGRLGTGLFPLSRVQPNRDGAIVDQTDLHIRAEFACLNGDAGLCQSVREIFI